MKLTKEQMAARINGREYGDELTDEEEAQAKESGLFVITGASDDLIEIYGVERNELEACGGAEFYLTKSGVPELPDEDEQETLRKFGVLEQVQPKGGKIFAAWGGGEFDWTFITDIPHETFEIFDAGEKYCRGIVIDSADLPTP